MTSTPTPEPTMPERTPFATPRPGAEREAKGAIEQRNAAEARIAELEAESARIRHNLEQWRGLSHDNAKAADDNAKAADATKARIAELEAECESLRSALRPLVQAFTPRTEGRDEAGCLHNSEDSRCSVYPDYTLLGDLRRARALLSPPAPKPGGGDAS